MFSFEQTFYENSQWWRLITPMFIHFSFAHLAFNCLWIYILGEKIEKFDGSLRGDIYLIGLTAVIYTVFIVIHYLLGANLYPFI